MATLADLFEDTPAEVVPTSPPKLTVVRAAPPPPVVQAASAQPVAQPTSRFDASEQKSRDSDSRLILESELKKAESRQTDLLREYNNGEPEKRGGEAQNYQKYVERVAELKASLARNESDMAGIRRELGRVPASKLTVVPSLTLSDPVPIAAYPPAQPAAQPAAQTAKDVGNFSDLFETTVPAYEPGSVVQKPVPQVSAYAGTRGDTGISGGDGPIAQAALKHLKALGAATASLADTTIGGIIPGVAGPLTYAGARALQLSPDEAAAAEKSVVGALEKPFGKAFGVTESPAYKGELSREIMDFIGKNVGKGAKYIAEQTGLPESDVANMIGTGLVGVAPVVGKVTAPVRRALGQGVYEITEPVARSIDNFAGKPVAAAVERPRVEPTMEAPLTEAAGSGAMSATQLADTQAAFAKRQEAAAAAKAAMPPPAATPTAVALPAGAEPGSVGAAAVRANPFAGKLTGEVVGSKGQFPQVKLSLVAENVPVTEQQLISRIAQEVNPGQPVRSGVITRNEGTLRTEHTEANMPNLTPRGQVLKSQIANEQNALTNFSKERIDATGASPTLLSDSMRGEVINDVFYGAAIEGEAATSLIAYLDQSKRQIYKSALDRVGSNQIKTSNIDNLLKNPQWKAGLEFKGVEGVAKGAEKYLNLAKTTGFEDVNGVMHPPGTVSTYDAVRKAVNAEWSPENASAIRKINEAIDKDIAAVADPALYKLGDKIHQVEKIIFGSKGIKNLFGKIDKNGVVLSSTPLEKIPTKLNELAKDQWQHIRGTLDELANGQVRGAPSGMPPVPAELRQAAAVARNEIDGALARAVYQSGSNKAGVWNQNSVNTTLNSVIGEKILENFPPSEVKKFHTLNIAGYLMPGIHSYEGAALQARRAGKIEAYAEKAGIGAGAATGGFVGSAFGPAGTTAGTVIGGEAGRRFGAAISGKQAAKAEAKAADALRNEMQKNAQLRDMLP